MISINTSAKTVQVRSRVRGLYEESYDSLILSPGAKPIRPPLPGINSERILTLRNIPDTDKVKAKVMEEESRSAIVIGGGFIGVEMAENLKDAGLDVTLIEAGPQLLAPFDPEMASVLAKELEDRGIGLLFSERVQAFHDDGSSIHVNLEHGTALQADLVLLAIGVTPDTGFLKNSGLDLGPRGHILVNDRLQTNIPGIYAVGDAVEVTDFVNCSKTAIPWRVLPISRGESPRIMLQAWIRFTREPKVRRLSRCSA